MVLKSSKAFKSNFEFQHFKFLLIFNLIYIFRNTDFTLFESMKEHPDLIFSDASVQLFPVETDMQTYLGSDIIELIHKTDPRICNSAINAKQFELISIILAVLVSSLFNVQF